jgi:uncharacterized protein (TIGR02300 family)
MPAKDLGTKYTCFKCATKFYDMRKGAPVCPKCGADQRESPVLKTPPSAERRQRAPARPVPAAPIEETEAEASELDEEVEEEGDEPAAEDEP